MTLPRPVVSLPRRRPSDDLSPSLSTSPFLNHGTYKGRRSSSGNHRTLTSTTTRTTITNQIGRGLHWILFKRNALWILLLLISLWFNWLHWNHKINVKLHQTVPLSIRSTLSSPHSNLKHLVMVPGHAIWTGCEANKAMQDDTWILEDLQKGGDVRAYIKHITKGAEIAVKDPQALLIFSGGMTRAHTDATEAISYYRLAKAGNIFSQFMNSQDKIEGQADFDRVTTEDYALDSYENVLFSIARFKEFTGRYPEFITAVGYGMKRQRYQDVHRAAARWPSHKFKYIGIDNDHEVEADYKGELEFGLKPWQQDVYGCKGLLLEKRKKRNIYRRFHPYHSSAPELTGLMEHCPVNNEWFEGRLPWTTDT
ncbi:hypothetical protein OIO90_004970 [Microbotryomycetes sp. JL221]|nr:hypothetical protein OIO90_004970 [Microbotryomycetes sp. JL221]